MRPVVFIMHYVAARQSMARDLIILIVRVGFARDLNAGSIIVRNICHSSPLVAPIDGVIAELIRFLEEPMMALIMDTCQIRRCRISRIDPIEEGVTSIDVMHLRWVAVRVGQGSENPPAIPDRAG